MISMLIISVLTYNWQPNRDWTGISWAEDPDQLEAVRRRIPYPPWSSMRHCWWHRRSRVPEEPDCSRMYSAVRLPAHPAARSGGCWVHSIHPSLLYVSLSPFSLLLLTGFLCAALSLLLVLQHIKCIFLSIINLSWYIARKMETLECLTVSIAEMKSQWSNSWLISSVW